MKVHRIIVNGSTSNYSNIHPMVPRQNNLMTVHHNITPSYTSFILPMLIAIATRLRNSTRSRMRVTHGAALHKGTKFARRTPFTVSHIQHSSHHGLYTKNCHYGPARHDTRALCEHKLIFGGFVRQCSTSVFDSLG